MFDAIVWAQERKPTLSQVELSCYCENQLPSLLNFELKLVYCLGLQVCTLMQGAETLNVLQTAGLLDTVSDPEAVLTVFGAHPQRYLMCGPSSCDSWGTCQLGEMSTVSWHLVMTPL